MLNTIFTVTLLMPGTAAILLPISVILVILFILSQQKAIVPIVDLAFIKKIPALLPKYTLIIIIGVSS